MCIRDRLKSIKVLNSNVNFLFFIFFLIFFNRLILILSIFLYNVPYFFTIYKEYSPNAFFKEVDISPSVHLWSLQSIIYGIKFSLVLAFSSSNKRALETSFSLRVDLNFLIISSLFSSKSGIFFWTLDSLLINLFTPITIAFLLSRLFWNSIDDSAISFGIVPFWISFSTPPFEIISSILLVTFFAVSYTHLRAHET